MTFREWLFKSWNMQELCPECEPCTREHVKPPFPPPSEIWEIDYAVLNGLGFPQNYRTDTRYRTVSVEDFETWLAYDETNLLEYIANYRDCENFAAILSVMANFWLPGMAIGEIWVGGGVHSQNLTVLRDTVRNEFIKKRYEPQTDGGFDVTFNGVVFMRF